MPVPSAHITLIGCGKMGSALLEGWQKDLSQLTFAVIEPHDITARNVPHYRTIDEAKTALAASDVIVLAVKPQGMENVCAQIHPHLPENCAVLSIAAGQSLSSFTRYFGENRPVIRAMPNTPAAIGKGMSVAIANPAATPDQKSLAHALLSCAGKTEWIEDESLMDAVTALSGSGPAYVFHLIEIMASAGEKIGLNKDLAMTLARQTVIGSAALAESQPEIPAATLRQNVTSPGGTTAAALEILMNGKWQEIFDQALAAARDRGQELNK